MLLRQGDAAAAKTQPCADTACAQAEIHNKQVMVTAVGEAVDVHIPDDMLRAAVLPVWQQRLQSEVGCYLCMPPAGSAASKAELNGMQLDEEDHESAITPESFDEYMQEK